MAWALPPTLMVPRALKLFNMAGRLGKGTDALCGYCVRGKVDGNAGVGQQSGRLAVDPEPAGKRIA